MIALSLLLIAGAVVFLVLGLWQSSSALLGASIAASLLAAVILVIGARRSVDRPAQVARERPRRDAPSSGGRPDQASVDEPEPDPPVDSDTTRSAPAGRGGRPERGGRPVTFPASPAAAANGATTDWAGSVMTEARSSAEPGAARSAGAAGASGSPAGSMPDRSESHREASHREAPGRQEAARAEPERGDRLRQDALSQPADQQGESLDEDEVDPPDEPAPQQVSAADAARVGRMRTEVLVVDGRPRYHLPGCVHLLGRESEPLPVGEALELGFSPCSLCEPDSALLADARRV